MATLSHNDIAKAIFIGLKDQKGADFETALDNSVKFLSRRNLLGKSKQIVEKLEKIVNEEWGILEVKVWTKDPLSSQVKKEITQILKQRYGDKELIFKEHIDETVLGGFKILVKDELIDLTLKTKIKNLQKHLIQSHE